MPCLANAPMRLRRLAEKSRVLDQLYGTMKDLAAEFEAQKQASSTSPVSVAIVPDGGLQALACSSAASRS